MSVKEIETAITQLSATELAKLVGDKQIEDNLEAGRLDALLADVDDDTDEDVDMIEYLLKHSYHIDTLTPLTRDELHERR